MRVWLPDQPERALIEPLPGGVVAAPVPADPRSAPDRDEVAFVVASHTDRALIEALPALGGLRVLQTLAAGVDWLVDAVPPGVTLCSASGTRDVPTAEWVVAAILAAVKDLPRATRQQDAGRWEPWSQEELCGKTVLIVGFGSIGRAVAARLAPFGVEVAGVASRAREGVHGPGELPTLLPRADVVVLLAPLTPATARMADAGFLAALPDGALVVNAARGGVLDTGALLAELEAGRLRAALDVTDPEPLPEGHPLWRAPNLLLTPHHAGGSRPALARAYALAREQIARFAAGEPLANVVPTG